MLFDETKQRRLARAPRSMPLSRHCTSAVRRRSADQIVERNNQSLEHLLATRVFHQTDRDIAGLRPFHERGIGVVVTPTARLSVETRSGPSIQSPDKLVVETRVAEDTLHLSRCLVGDQVALIQEYEKARRLARRRGVGELCEGIATPVALRGVRLADQNPPPHWGS